MGQDGDAKEFFAKVTGFGYNDMISLPTLTKDSILDNLKRRFKVCARVSLDALHHTRHAQWMTAEYFGADVQLSPKPPRRA